MADKAYTPASEMSLWWLGQTKPQLIGQLVLAENNRKVGLAYADESSISNALSQVAAFGLKLSEAKDMVSNIQKVVATWPEHFAQMGVRAREIEMLRVSMNRFRQ